MNRRGLGMRPGVLLTVLPLFMVLFGRPVGAVEVTYVLSMTSPHTHYFEVQIEVEGFRKQNIDFVMPVWTPGSYLVREFAKNVVDFSAETGDGQELRWQKINKNTWRVEARKSRTVRVRYRVYAFQISVRTSFLDDSHGYVNGASVFMYPDGLQNQPLKLRIRPFSGWRNISTGLKHVPGEGQYAAANYDELVDSPIEIGNHQVYEFIVREVPHYVAIYGPGNYDAPKLVEGMKKVVEQAAEMFGGLPYPQYTFIVHMLPRGGGGLEHANSTTLQTSGFGFDRDGTSRGFFGLTAHEFFHTWNVKRIRPIELGPFDYTRENYTTLLWVAEGFTSYYSAVLLRRAGITTPRRFLESMAAQIRTLQQTPGRRVQSVSGASFDAWIKFYRRNENSINTEVSYYNKGAVLGMLLDLQIRHSSQNTKSLDDLMRHLYKEYAVKKKRGFTEKEIQAAAEKIAGADLEEFFADYVHGKTELDYDQYLSYAGLRLEVGRGSDQEESEEERGEEKVARPFLGIRVSLVAGLPTIRAVYDGTPAYEAGLNVNDELIAINGFRVDERSWSQRVQDHVPGDTLRVTVARLGRLREFDVVLAPAPADKYRIVKLPEASSSQQAIYESWTGEPWTEKKEEATP